MKRQEYINRLNAALSNLNYLERQEIVNDIIDHFEEARQAGLDEEAVSEKLGTPESVAATYFDGSDQAPETASAAEKDNQQDTAPEPGAATEPHNYQNGPYTDPNMFKKPGTDSDYIVYGVLFLVFGIPILMTILSLYIGLWSGGIGMIISGIAVLAVGITVATGMMLTGIIIAALSISVFGLGMLLLGIGLIKNIVKLCRWYVNSAASLFKTGKTVPWNESGIPTWKGAA